jgi:hypothetical protein
MSSRKARPNSVSGTDDARGGRSERQGQRLSLSSSLLRRPAAPQQSRGPGSGGGPGSAPAAVSLESFAQRKGHIRALEEFKKRKQTHRMETAKAFRRYR